MRAICKKCFEQKILNHILQNIIEKLKDDNNKIATHIREVERTNESQKDAFINCTDHALCGCERGAKHIQRPQEDPKLKASTDMSLTVEEQWNICAVERGKKYEQY